MPSPCPKSEIAQLSSLLSGRVTFPGESDWDDSRRAFNLRVDQRPVAVAFPADERDVAAVVNYAREHGLRVAPQLTAHNAAAIASLEGAILLNTSKLRNVAIDAGSRRVRAGAGLRWGDVTPQLCAVGLAALHGSSPDVGIVGYSLGGGMGWLARKYGLQSNSITAIELVTADGQLVRTDADREPELFWALRGGGGNFGVVTALEFEVYPVEELYAGAMFFPMARASEVLHAWNELLPSLPDEITTWACLLRLPDIPDLPEPFRGGEFAAVVGAFLGGEADGRELLRPVRDLGPAIDTFRLSGLDALGDLAMDPRDPLPYVSTHQLLGELPASAIDDFVDAAGPGRSWPIIVVQLRHLGGALARTAPGAGAQATMPGEHCLFAAGVAGDETASRDAWAGFAAIESALHDYRIGQSFNFVETPGDPQGFFDAETWARLCRVKAHYDPDNLFRANHEIPPHR